VADGDAIVVSHRPYRPSRGIEQASFEIKEHAGSLYDPDVVNACLELFKEGFSFIKSEVLQAINQLPLQ